MIFSRAPLSNHIPRRPGQQSISILCRSVINKSTLQIGRIICDSFVGFLNLPLNGLIALLSRFSKALGCFHDISENISSACVHGSDFVLSYDEEA